MIIFSRVLKRGGDYSRGGLFEGGDYSRDGDYFFKGAEKGGILVDSILCLVVTGCSDCF